MTSNSFKDILQSAVQLNKDHQYALNVYTERLEAELEAVDKLLNIAELEEEESNLEIAGYIRVAGVGKPMGLLSSTELLSQDSPFYDDATRRQRFLNLTEHHPMKPKEVERLTEAVRLENRRLRAHEARQRGEHPFASQFDMGDLEATEGLDWERIAEKVFPDCLTISQRLARECEIRWLGDRHPRFNHSSWPASEIAAAKALVEGCEGRDLDWVSIAEQLGTRRTPIDVMRHAITRKTHVWDAESDKRLVEAVKKYGTESWALASEVARAVSEDAQMNSCQNRWYRTLDPSIRRGNWSPEEDAQLRLAVDLYGHAWMEVASVIPGRNNEQCRDRWSERLNPKIPRGKWSTEEDARLLSAIEEFGVGRWKEVSERVGTGRTDNTCRYHYDTLKGPDNPDITSATSEALTVVAAAQGPSSSKQRQRNRKGKERGLPCESTGLDATPIEGASQEPQTRTKKGRKTQAKRVDCEAVEHDTAPPEAGSQPPPLRSSKKARPRARPLNREKAQAHETSATSPQPQNMDQTRPTVSEEAADGTVELAHTSLPAQAVENVDSRNDTEERSSRKRPNLMSHELDFADKSKRQKISGQRQTQVTGTPKHSIDDAAAKSSYI
ncbi:hypothetical protein BC826DRAFT_1138792 [Russula brevipes]|nr:hypothetical protein BC826DRAFT_1138792 [Russula brevipes]